MYTRLPKLSDVAIDKLLEISNEVNLITAEGHRLRRGASGADNLSVYRYSRWFDWTREQRKLWKQCLPKCVVDRAIQCWFQVYPQERGLLDRMNAWEGNTNCGTVVAYALCDDAKIIIDNETVYVEKGEGVSFHLSTPHEIKRVVAEQRWACVMTKVAHTCHVE